MKKPRRPSLLNTVAMFVPLALVATVFIFSNQSPPAVGTQNTTGNLNCTEIHWHALLKIYLNEDPQFIPANIGTGNIGLVIDTGLSGANASPMHTHDASGVIHIENQCPEKNPETAKLGYFFKVWEKPFNSTCILDKCNDGTRFVQMKVNGIENSEFDRYAVGDEDEIVITYDKPRLNSKSKNAFARLAAR
jgi:hypothetical protein